MKAWIQLFLFLFCTELLIGQDLAIGEWRVHLPYNKALNVADAGDLVYCASAQGLFVYDRNDNSVSRLSKITGLSDISISKIRFSFETQTLVVAYTNTNIDLIHNGKVVNLSDIKRKNITGNKVIHNISFIGNDAYLACGFGIVVVDLIREEIKDTYYIGPNGSDLNVYDITADAQFIFAATESGIARAELSNPNLSNFNSWSVIKDDYNNAGDYTLARTFAGRLFVNFAMSQLQDSLLYLDLSTGIWHNNLVSGNFPNLSLYTGNNKLLITNEFSVAAYDANLVRTDLIYNYAPEVLTRDAVVDNNNIFWIADNASGLVKYESSSAIELIIPDGPQSANTSDLKIDNGRLWTSHGPSTNRFNQFIRDGVSTFQNNSWTTYNSASSSNHVADLDTIWDWIQLAIDPSNNGHVFIGTMGKGLLEFTDGSLTAVYNQYNSILNNRQDDPNFKWVGVQGIAFDDQGNLWMTNSYSNNSIAVKKSNGDWNSFNFSGTLSNNLIGELIIDDLGYKWVNVNGNGLLVFDDNGTIDNKSDDRHKKLSNSEGNGNLPTADVRSMVKDREGEIWIGTSQGVAVFYSPGSIFGSGNFDAQKVLIQQDGSNQYLLETEVVTAIAIDGGNRKWFGTEGGGVFLMSEDGTRQLQNFNTSNSPILSNNIIKIAVDDESGEVFFATSNGLISYKGTATGGGDDFEDPVYVYPNPVKPGYNGLIAIKGLVRDVNVKITDVSGNLIFETEAEGGQAVWNGRNFSGEKASSGIYLVFVSDEEGNKTHVTKLMIIN